MQYVNVLKTFDIDKSVRKEEQTFLGYKRDKEGWENWVRTLLLLIYVTEIPFAKHIFS